MDKLKLNYWIDVGLAVSFFACFSTGLIKFPLLVKIIGASTYQTLPLGIISFVHTWSGIIMGVFVLIHLGLHWNWIVNVTKKMFKKENSTN